jgi:hypothetical protein
MKKVFFLLVSMIICGSFYSCSGDDDDKEKQENAVKFKVYSNTKGVPITISGSYGGQLIIKDYWERDYVTKQWVVELSATCEVETVLISCEIYVNGKLKERNDGNNHVRVSVRVKE